jgi:N-acetylglucosamine kinase-like BadF-type ATPase
MTRYFLGIDIGATKSHALIADEIGQAVGFGEAGPGNYEVVGWQGLQLTLRAAVQRALVSANVAKSQIAGIGCGIGGYDWPSERQPTLQAIRALGIESPLALSNDAIISLVAGAPQGWGVVLIAGTSNNCRGRDRQGREGRVTGCGPLFGEYGGSTELVARAIQAVALAWTRRGPDTLLAKAFLELTGASSVAELLEGLALERYHISSSAAPLVFEVAHEGDAVAQEAVRWAGRELASLGIGVIHQLGFEELEFDLVLAGSLYKGGSLLIEPMAERIRAVAPGVRFVHLAAPPVTGAVLLGMESAGLQDSVVRQPLIASTEKLLASRDPEP